jgi:hypothetical protein
MQQQQVIAVGNSMMGSVAAAAAAASAAAAAAARCWMPPTPNQHGAVARQAECEKDIPVLKLGELVLEDELGSAERPTVGSSGHRFRNCKPCAFFHTKGCEKGVNCSFCHLCPAGEKKRRQKEKAIVQRESCHFSL